MVGAVICLDSAARSDRECLSIAWGLQVSEKPINHNTVILIMYKTMLRFVLTSPEETNKQKTNKPTKTCVPFACNKLQIPVIWKIKYITEEIIKKLEQVICVLQVVFSVFKMLLFCKLPIFWQKIKSSVDEKHARLYQMVKEGKKLLTAVNCPEIRSQIGKLEEQWLSLTKKVGHELHRLQTLLKLLVRWVQQKKTVWSMS